MDENAEAIAVVEEALEQIEKKALKPVPEKVDYTLMVSASKLLPFLSALKCIRGDVILEVSDKGWHVQAVDSAHVSYAEVSLTDMAFDAIIPSITGTTQVSKFILPTGQLYSMVKRAMQGGSARSVGDNLVLRIEHNVDDIRYTIKYDFTVQEIVVGNSFAGISSPTKVGLDEAKLTHVATTDWHKMVARIKIAAEVDKDHIILENREGELWVAAGSEHAKQSFASKIADYCTGEAGIKTVYPVEWLLPIIRSVNLDRAKVLFAKDWPLVIRFDAGFLNGRFIVAPRIDNSDSH